MNDNSAAKLNHTQDKKRGDISLTGFNIAAECHMHAEAMGKLLSCEE
jgi:hypothetical protein